MNKKSLIIITMATLLWSFLCGYWVGSNHRKIQYITKEIEVVKQISQERAKIYSRPHITRDTALKLMRENIL